MKQTIHTKSEIDAALALIQAELTNIVKQSECCHAGLHFYDSGTLHISVGMSGTYSKSFLEALNAPPPPTAAERIRAEIAAKQAELAKLEGNHE